MKSSDIDPVPYEILVEYEFKECLEFDDNQNESCSIRPFLYLNFESNSLASLFYFSMDLKPLFADIDKSRIIIMPAIMGNPYGVHDIDHSQNVYIQFPESEIAKKFYQTIILAKKNNEKLKKIPEVQLKDYTRVQFQNLIHPDYSFEKRIKANLDMSKQLAYYFFILKNIPFTDQYSDYSGFNPFISKESFRNISICVFWQMIFIFDPLHFPVDYRVRQIQLTSRFGLPPVSQYFRDKARQRINIRGIKYSTASDNGRNKIYHLHFIGESEIDHQYLALKFKAAGKKYSYVNGKDYEVTVVCNEVRTDTKTFVRMFGIKFGNINDLDQFLDSVYFVNLAGIVRDEKNSAIYFSETLLSRQKKFEINVWPGCENVLRKLNVDSQDKNGLKVFVDTIQIEKIKPLSENIYQETPQVRSVDKLNAIKIILKEKGINPLVAIFSNQEKILESTNAIHVMPDHYLSDKGLMENFHGLYLVNSVKDEFDDYLADFVFIHLPDLDGVDIEHFSRKSWIKHVTILFIMQFYLARFSGNVLIIDKCEFANDEDLSAIIWQVNHMPEFKNVQVFFALGEDSFGERSLHTIYSNPLKKKMEEASAIINEIRKETDLNIVALSKKMHADYQHAKKLAPLISEIHQFIDEKIIKNLSGGVKTKLDSYSVLFNSLYSIWYSEEEMQERIQKQNVREWIINTKIKSMIELKQDIKTGLLADIPLSEIIFAVRKKYEYVLFLDREGNEAADSVYTIKVLGDLEKRFCGREEKKSEFSLGFR